MTMVLKHRLSQLWGAMKRTKQMDKDSLETPLRRCLTAFDLTLLGIGNMAGSGIYVLTGTVIRNKAGPAAFLSYLIAGITALLNALCYAELGSRIPKAGSAYSYTYIASGEFLAFVIGWSVILEYVLCVSSVARGWSGTVDAMTNGAIGNGTMDTIGRFPKQDEWLSEYPDFLAMGIVVVLGMMLVSGPKMSANFNTVITSLNILVIFIATTVMFSHPQHDPGYAPEEKGGFFPNHFSGIIAGAGTCFYSFIGFDAITVSSEEAANPRHSMPIATAASVSFVTILFVLAAIALPLFVPWYTVDKQAAFTAAFKARGITWATYVTGIGSLLGISASLFTSMYAMPRIVYAMAQDGLLPSPLGYVLPATQVPVVALGIFGALAALLALLFDIATLADFLSIGTLIAYTIVCANVIILRYRRPQLYSEYNPIEEGGETPSESEVTETKSIDDATWTENIGRLKSYFRNVPVLRHLDPGEAPLAALIIMVCFSCIFCALTLVGTRFLTEAHWWAVILEIICLVGIIACIFIMLMHEQNERIETFKVPFVPVVPCLTIIINITLIVKLSPMTWVRFIVWLALGLVIYFVYGIRNSVQGIHNEDEHIAAASLESAKLVHNEETEYPQPRYDSTKEVPTGH